MQLTWISVYFICFAGTVAIEKFNMHDHCGGRFSTYQHPSSEDIIRISFKYSLHILHHDCKLEGWSKDKFLIAFADVNFPTHDCEANLTVQKHSRRGADYGVEIEGIPTPLCKNNIPWKTYPSPAYPGTSYLQLLFKGSRSTPEDTGFEILLVKYYTNALGCRKGDYQCDNHRCIPLSVHDCDGVDWCGDQSGCVHNTGPDTSLIAGLCAGIGVAILAGVIAVCVLYHRRRKSNRPIAVPSAELSHVPTGKEQGHVTALTVAPQTQEDRRSPEAGHEQQSKTHPLPSAPPMDVSLENKSTAPHPSENVESVSSTADGSDQRLLRNEDVTHGVQ